jgi:threonine aldolase
MGSVFPPIADFRSDTFTKPSAAMLQFMLQAEVGDDVFGEDPSVNELERRMATLFGKESAMFCPTGTMSNQIAIKTHTQPGDEVICESLAHVYIYEGGGIAFHSGAQVKPIHGESGIVSADLVRQAINPDDVHKARTSLVCLENTSNRGGGTCYSLDQLQSIAEVCWENNLKLHLDGARLFNALVATGQSASTYGQLFSTLSVCFNKGMGCPIGSVLIGDSDLILRARRIRKVFGGGMRQAGYMAAAALYALDHHLPKLKEDHHHAKMLHAAWKRSGLNCQLNTPETNILLITLSDANLTDRVVAVLDAEKIRTLAIAKNQIRMVTHLDVTEEMVERTCGVIEKLSSMF